MCDFGEPDEWAKVWNQRAVRARKSYRCDDCGSGIDAGDYCISHFSVYEESVTSGRRCIPCDVNARDFEREHEFISVGPGDLTTFLTECIAEGDDDAQRWVDMLEEVRSRGPHGREGVGR